MRTLYLINPLADFPTYFSAEVMAGLGLGRGTLMADLAAPSLARMASPYFDVKLCDENLSSVDFDIDADIVGITGKITQRGRMISIANEFRRRGKTVVIGGPYASLSPEDLRPYCDVLVRGEIEEICDDVFSDLSSGSWKDEYVGDRPDLAKTVLPRWDLYPNDRAISGTVQTSRGCPFECEFCDVIVYLGRKQRHKPISRIVEELDYLYQLGYRDVFIADDNFTAYRSRARELLLAMRGWNERQPEPVAFTTQVSIDAAKDEELIASCWAAGIHNLFVGIETTNEDSLRESKKRQNLRVDLIEQVNRIVDQGIAVTAGMIVGFDNDGPDTFERQFSFAMDSPIPIFSLGALVAPKATPLFDRMERDGRLAAGSEVAAMPWSSNIVPVRMSHEELLNGLKWLCNSIYSPHAFAERVVRFVERAGKAAARPGKRADYRPVEADALQVLSRFEKLGPGEAAAWPKITKALARYPSAQKLVSGSLFIYMQVRHMYEKGRIWEPIVTTGGQAVAPTPTAGRVSPKSLPLAAS